MITTLSYSQATLLEPNTAQINLSKKVLFVSVNADPNLPIKTIFNNQNAVLISESQMDSINLKYLRYDFLNAKFNSQTASYDVLKNQFNQVQLSANYYKDENIRLVELNRLNTSLFENIKEMHLNELAYYKQKAKGKFKHYLIGAGAMSVIVLIAQSL